MNIERESRLNLRAGDWVEVRSKAAVLSTLDANGRLDELPFMPEMFACCGKRFRVWKRAHKTCDTVNKTGGRRIAATVHLEDVRCDGAAHGGCQAACLIFWKTAWLVRVDGPSTSTRPAGELRGSTGDRISASGEDRVWAATQASGAGDKANPTYVCQATLLPQATTLLPWWDVRQYLEDCTSGNTSVWQILSGGIYVGYYSLVKSIDRYSHRLSAGLIRVYDRVQALRGGAPYPRRWGTVPPGEKTPSRPLHLKAGDLVRVRPYEEILATLDINNRNRGLYFDAEEVPYCGQTFRVRSAITNFIDEKTGKMLTLKDRNVILEGVICQARYSDRRMFCPRAIYSYWRETWLEKVMEDTPGRPDAVPAAQVGGRPAAS
jgi:hypothetical protein